jgi:N,N'-diacetylchitobiose transport system permease protein
MSSAATTAAHARPRQVSGRRYLLRRRTRYALFNVAGVVTFVLMAFPVYWMVATSLKTGDDINAVTPSFIPRHVTFANFSAAAHQAFFADVVRNSAIVVVATVAIALALAFFAAVAVARFDFGGRKAFLVMIVVVQMVPLNAMIIPIYLLLNSAGQLNKLSGVIVTYLTFVLPFTIWTLRGFVVNIPKDLEEAAMVDGCTRVGAFRRILFPLVAPGLVATAIYAFIQAWNEYIVAYVLLSDQSKQTATVWLASFLTARGTQWGPLLAASTMIAIPVVVFFALIHKRVTEGLTAGAVKG